MLSYGSPLGRRVGPLSAGTPSNASAGGNLIQIGDCAPATVPSAVGPQRGGAGLHPAPAAQLPLPLLHSAVAALAVAGAQDKPVGPVSVRPEPATGGRLGTIGNSVSGEGDSEQRQGKRRLRFQLLAQSQRLSLRKSVSFCRLARVDRVGVDIVADAETGQCRYEQVATCGSVWECPMCAATVKRRYAEEIRWTVAAHRAESESRRGHLLTLTIRHGSGDSLAVTLRGLTDAWRWVQSGRQWQTARKTLGLEYIRAVEITHGDNGWHPHLHVVLLSEGPLGTDFTSWLRDRWEDAVARNLPSRCRPSSGRGLRLDALHEVDYISKMCGDELADGGGAKLPKNGNRTPWQILRDSAGHGGSHPGEVELSRKMWREYATATLGTRFLGWSRGLSAVRERAREVLDAEPDPDVGYVTSVLAAEWDQIQYVPGILPTLLEAAERGGAPEVSDSVKRALLAAEAGRRHSALRRRTSALR